MNDAACIALLRWALPRLGLRWAGFRRVRRQVCRRIGRRLGALGLADAAAYRDYLEAHPDEWAVLDGLTHVTVSSFYRDPAVFDALGRTVLPALARAARARGATSLRCWSAGCASGEEPYTLVLAWTFEASRASPPLALEVVATDADAHLIERARAARYKASSLRRLPRGWRDRAFVADGGSFVLRPEFRAPVALMRQDVRRDSPAGPFDLVLCRNLAFTYFAEPVQRAVAARLADALAADGVLATGARERPPDGAGFAPVEAASGLWRRAPD